MTPNFTTPGLPYKVWRFPSGELQVQLLTTPYGNPENRYTITGSVLSSDHLIELMQLVEAIRAHLPLIQLHLVMPYCAYSRQDRRCNPGEAFSLKVFTTLINSCNFTTVTTYDNHSDVATALINNCTNLSVSNILVRANYLDNMTLNLDQYDYLISPDAGANKKVFNVSKTFNIPMIRADKTRDTETGAILETKIYTDGHSLANSTVLIIDDICQGGRTFEELAKAIKTVEPTCTIHLYVTHGFFSHQFGIQYMQSAGISKFITTNSVYRPRSLQDQFVTILEL